MIGPVRTYAVSVPCHGYASINDVFNANSRNKFFTLAMTYDVTVMQKVTVGVNSDDSNPQCKNNNMSIIRSIVVAFIPYYYFGKALCYSSLAPIFAPKSPLISKFSSKSIVASNDVRGVSKQACGRFRPCGATDTRRISFDEATDPEDSPLKSDDLDASFRLEMERRQSTEVTSEMVNNNINEQMMEKLLQKQREEQAALERALRADLEAKYARVMDERLKKQASDKDGEINKLVLLKEQRETEINRLKFQLNESKAAMDESANRVKEAESRFRSLKQEYATKTEADKSLLDRITDQFSKEKDALADRIKSLNEELKETTSKSQREQEEIKSLLEVEETKSKQITEDLQKAKKDHELELVRLENELEESRKRQKNINAVTGYEKRELRKVTWELETKLEAAKYDLITAKKDYQLWKNEATILQLKLKELQESSEATITELQEQLSADRMFYARAKQTSRNRIQNIVQMFSRRMERRKRKANNVLEESISQWQQKLDNTREALEEEKRQLSASKDEVIARNDFEARSKITALQTEMDNTIMELSERIAEVRAEGRSALNNLRVNHEKDVANIMSKNDRDTKGLIREMEKDKDRAIQLLKDQFENEKIVIQRESERQTAKSIDLLKAQVDRDKHDLRLDYTQQIMRERNLRINLEDKIQEVQAKMTEYEKERSSLRNLVLLSWRLSKQRCLKLIRRR